MECGAEASPSQFAQEGATIRDNYSSLRPVMHVVHLKHMSTN